MKNTLLTLGFVFILSLIIVSCDEEQITEPQHHHYEAYGVNIYNADTLYLRVFNAVIDTNYNKSFALVPNSPAQKFKIVFLGEDGKEMAYPDDEEKLLGWLIADTTIANAVQSDSFKWELLLNGLKEGNTNIEIRVNHLDHPDFKTPVIPIEVK